MAEWLKALVSKTGIPFTGYRGFESPFFRKDSEQHRNPNCGAVSLSPPPPVTPSLFLFPFSSFLSPLSSLLLSYPPIQTLPVADGPENGTSVTKRAENVADGPRYGTSVTEGRRGEEFWRRGRRIKRIKEDVKRIYLEYKEFRRRMVRRMVRRMTKRGTKRRVRRRTKRGTKRRAKKRRAKKRARRVAEAGLLRGGCRRRRPLRRRGGGRRRRCSRAGGRRRRRQ